MDVIELLSELEEVIEKGFEIPIIKKTFIDKEQVMELLETEMKNAVSLSVNMEVGTAYGYNWYDAH